MTCKYTKTYKFKIKVVSRVGTLTTSTAGIRSSEPKCHERKTFGKVGEEASTSLCSHSHNS